MHHRGRKQLISAVSAAALTLALLILPQPSARAVKQEEIDELQAQRDELAVELDAKQEVLDQLEAEHAHLIDRKLAMDERIELLRQEIPIIEKQIEIYTILLDKKTAELEEAQENELRQTEALRGRLRAMEEQGSLSYTYLAYLFEAEDLSDLLGRMGDVSDILHYDRMLEQSYIRAREKVETAQNEYRKALEKQEAALLDRKESEELLESDIEQACELLASIDELTDDAAAEYAAIEANIAAADKEIDRMVWELKNTSSAVSLSNLIWPVPSCSVITSRFGHRVSPTTGASTYHGGLDIGAQYGVPILAAQNGTVSFSGVNGGYGNCVMLSHGNGIVTLYGHMSSIAVYAGAYVVKGQVIGYVGSTGVSTGPHCHFEIRVNGAQTDPSVYFGGLTYRE